MQVVDSKIQYTWEDPPFPAPSIKIFQSDCCPEWYLWLCDMEFNQEADPRFGVNTTKATKKSVWGP
jgi:hypothetical protein